MSKIVTGHAFGYQEMPTELSPPPENRLSAVEYFWGYSYSVDKKEVEASAFFTFPALVLSTPSSSRNKWLQCLMEKLRLLPSMDSFTSAVPARDLLTLAAVVMHLTATRL